MMGAAVQGSGVQTLKAAGSLSLNRSSPTVLLPSQKNFEVDTGIAANICPHLLTHLLRHRWLLRRTSTKLHA